MIDEENEYCEQLESIASLFAIFILHIKSLFEYLTQYKNTMNKMIKHTTSYRVGIQSFRDKKIKFSYPCWNWITKLYNWFEESDIDE